MEHIKSFVFFVFPLPFSVICVASVVELRLSAIEQIVASR